MYRLHDKDWLLRILLIVSIITVSVVGFAALRDLSGNFFYRISNAMKSVLYPFSIALILSFVVGPLSRLIDRKTFLNRTLSIITAITLGIIAVLTILSVTVAFVIVQLNEILSTLIGMLDSDGLSGILSQIESVISSWSTTINTEELFRQIQEGTFSLNELTGFIRAAFSAAVNFTTSLTHTLFTIVLTPVFMFFLIRDRDRIFRGIVGIFPASMQPHLYALGKRSHTVINGYFIGHGLVMLFITIFFIITYAVLSLFIPNFTLLHALLFAIVMGLFSIIPYLGVWFSMAMPIVMLTMLHMNHGQDTNIYLFGIVMIFVLNIVEEIIESSIIQPNVFSRHVHIHPLAVLSSFIFFGGIFGLVGFILAVPIAGIIKAVYRHFTDDELSDESPGSSG